MAGLFAMFCQRTRCRALSVADSLARDALLGGNFDFTARTSLARERWGGGVFLRPMSRLRAGEIEGLRSAYNIGFVDWPKRNLVSRALESSQFAIADLVWGTITWLVRSPPLGWWAGRRQRRGGEISYDGLRGGQAKRKCQAAVACSQEA